LSLNPDRKEDHEATRLPNDFYSVAKVDNHIHLAAGMPATDFRDFIEEKRQGEADVVVMSGKDGPKTLSAVLLEAGLNPKETVTVDRLEVMGDYQTFQRFDTFNSKYSPFRSDALRGVFLKTDNFMRGRYFAEITQRCVDRLARSGTTFAEYRVSVYGLKQAEWPALARWLLGNSCAEVRRLAQAAAGGARAAATNEAEAAGGGGTDHAAGGGGSAKKKQKAGKELAVVKPAAAAADKATVAADPTHGCLLSPQVALLNLVLLLYAMQAWSYDAPPHTACVLFFISLVFLCFSPQVMWQIQVPRIWSGVGARTAPFDARAHLLAAAHLPTKPPPPLGAAGEASSSSSSSSPSSSSSSSAASAAGAAAPRAPVFGVLLAHLFGPLVEATLEPANHPELAKVLESVGGMDSVDDESRAEVSCQFFGFPAPYVFDCKSSPSVACVLFVGSVGSRKSHLTRPCCQPGVLRPADQDIIEEKTPRQ